MICRKKLIKKTIESKEQEIEAIEKKLFRSSTALIIALIDGKKPSKKEADYFKMYASVIENARRELVELNKPLAALDPPTT